MRRTGGCLCGAVRFACEGEPINVRVCHCRLCQKAYGATFNARALYPHEAITLTGPTASYPTSDMLDRVFCTTCGTRVMSWRKEPKRAGVSLACFDDPSVFSPTEHMWVSSKAHWLGFDGAIPEYEDFPPT